MPIDTTPEKTLELLRAAVAERGADFTFPQEWNLRDEETGYTTGTCTYVQPDNDEPACIAGYVFHAYGMTLEELRAEEGSSADTIAGLNGFDPASKRILSVAQLHQDSGKTWGFSVEQAEFEYKRVSKLVEAGNG